MGAIGLHEWSGRMREISLFLTFISFFLFLHLACRSPRLTDFDDLYVKMHSSAQGSAFWGSWWQPEMFRGWNPQNPNGHFKPNFRKLKSDRHKILNIASGHQADLVGGLKIKSNQIKDGGGRYLGKRKITNLATVWAIVTKFGMMVDMDSPQRAVTSLLTSDKIQDGGRPPYWKGKCP